MLRNPTISRERAAIRDTRNEGVTRSTGGRNEREVHVHVCRSCASEKECPPIRARARVRLRDRARACASKENVHVSSCVPLGARGEEAIEREREREGDRDREEMTRGEKRRVIKEGPIDGSPRGRTILPSVLLDTKMAEKIVRSRARAYPRCRAHRVARTTIVK